MTAFLAIQSAALLSAAFAARGAGTPASARRRALAGTGAAALLAVAALLARSDLRPLAAHLVIPVVGVTAIGLSPASETSSATFARILLLITLALLFVASSHPLILAGLWAGSAFVLWIEVKSSARARRRSRLVAFYHFPSVALFAVGAALVYRGHGRAAVVPLLLAIVIREAIIPVHSWFPPLVREAPMGAVIAFVAPQLGVHGYIQLVSGVVPPGWQANVTAGSVFMAALTALVAAALAAVQTDARRALAYLMMSQSGLVVFGLRSPSAVAHAGALLTWQVVALASSALAMTVAALAARRGHLALGIPQGSFTRTPRMAVAFLVLGFASVGLPFTLGFVAEEVLVQGVTGDRPVLSATLIVAAALSSIAVMRAFFVLFSGTAQHRGEPDLTSRELAIVSLVAGLLLLGGTFPQIALALVTAQ